MRRHQGNTGSQLPFPVELQKQYGGQIIRSHGDPMLFECHFREDFLGDVTDRMGVFDNSATGDPTAVSGLVANGVNGEYLVKLATTSEAETFAKSFGDKCNIPANVRWYFEARVKFSGITTNQVGICGLASAGNATLDSVAVNAWFRLQGSLALLTELDDNTTDSDDRAGDGKTLTADTYYIFAIERGADGQVYYTIADGDGTNRSLYDTIDGSALPSTTLQPFVGVQKASGATQPSVTIDYVRCFWDRF